MKSKFLFSPEMVYLNHGSFGACPIEVFNDYQNWQRKLEDSPVQFITKTGIEALDISKKALAGYINCDSEDFFFTSNPTTAINTVMRSLKLNEGDEILTTDLEYGAMDYTWQFFEKQTKAKYVRQSIELPIKSKEHFLEMFWKGYNENTKVIFISQITSATAIIFPIKEIVTKAKQLGLITIIDGAHVPGHIDLDIKSMDPDYYTGALHKWLLAPKGSTFLYVKKVLQKNLDPLIISWGYGNPRTARGQFLDYHEYNGTRDFSAYLTVPSLLKFRKDNNWEVEIKKCRQLILEWYPKFCELLDTKPICPVSSDFLGQMFTVIVNTEKPIKLKEELFNRFKIEIPITEFKDKYGVRLSVQPYTTISEIELLYDSLKKIKEEGVLIK
ncbi:MAG: aminotransferase class V-fold PLP-dependent enzyme [Vicingaceae bacterium]|nr:aminotransferase class V-fold PLP-dependent enzyme [Vicingaceae bacterium]